MVPLRGWALPEAVSLTQPLFLLVFKAGVMATSLPGTGTLGWGTSFFRGTFAIEISLPIFNPPHVYARVHGCAGVCRTTQFK